MVLRRAWLIFLLLALVAAQTLGLVHQGAHGHERAGHGSESISFGLAHGHAQPAGLASLLGSHGEEPGCLLFDQLSHGAGFGLSAPVVPALVAALFLLPLYEGAALARRAALFEARAPPASH